MNLKSLKFMYDILDDKIRDRDFKGSINDHKQAIVVHDELHIIINTAKKQSASLRSLRKEESIRLPVRVPFTIEVDDL